MEEIAATSEEAESDDVGGDTFYPSEIGGDLLASEVGKDTKTRKGGPIFNAYDYFGPLPEQASEKDQLYTEFREFSETLASPNFLNSVKLKKERVRSIKTLWRDIGRAKVTPDSIIINNLLKGLALCGEFDMAFEIFVQMKFSRIQPTIETYQSLLELTATFKEERIAVWLGNRILKSNLVANDTIVALILRSFTDGLRASEYFRTLRTIYYHRTKAYNELLYVLVKFNLEKEALEWLDEMDKHLVPRQVDTYIPLFKHFSASNPDKAMELFRNMIKNEKNANDYAYNAIIREFARVGNTNQCLQLWNEMAGNHITPTRETYLNVMWVLMRSGAEEMTMKALELYEKFVGEEIWTTKIAYNLFILLHLMAGDFEKAESLSKSMETTFGLLRTKTRNLFLAFAPSYEKAIEIYTEMNSSPKKEYRPDLVTYALVANAMQKANQPEESVKELFTEMQRAKYGKSRTFDEFVGTVAPQFNHKLSIFAYTLKDNELVEVDLANVTLEKPDALTKRINYDEIRKDIDEHDRKKLAGDGTQAAEDREEELYETTKFEEELRALEEEEGAEREAEEEGEMGDEEGESKA